MAISISKETFQRNSAKFIDCRLERLRQDIRVNELTSTLMENKIGLPQGSIWSVFVYNLY